MAKAGPKVEVAVAEADAVPPPDIPPPTLSDGHGCVQEERRSLSQERWGPLGTSFGLLPRVLGCQEPSLEGGGGSLPEPFVSMLQSEANFCVLTCLSDLCFRYVLLC